MERSWMRAGYRGLCGRRTESHPSVSKVYMYETPREIACKRITYSSCILYKLSHQICLCYLERAYDVYIVRSYVSV